MRAALGLALLCAAGTAAAQPALVRLGTHGGFGRVVFEFPQTQVFTAKRGTDAVTLHFPGGGVVASPDSGTARNVKAVTGGEETATVTMTPGATLKITRLGNRVVVDVSDPPSAKRAAAPLISARNGARATQPPDRLDVEARPAADPAPARLLPAVEPVSVQPPPPGLHDPAPPPRVAPPTETLAIAATLGRPAGGAQGHAMLLPFGPAVAAAAFRHGGEAWVVFDERRPLDLSALTEAGVFPGATVDIMPAATVLRFKLAPDRTVRLERRPDGWSVMLPESAGGGANTMPVSRPSRLLFPVATPGQIVAVPDAETGRNLLVGTLQAAGVGVPVALRTPEFAVWPSWQGVVMEPVSDQATMRSVPGGFAVETGAALSTRAGNGAALASAASLTRRFDFPAEPVSTLLRRLQAQVQAQGDAPPQARLEPRKAAAQTMLALGLGAEAQSLLRLAVSEDPRAATDPDIEGLTGIAALLSGRPDEAAGLDAAGLSGSDEIALWRAVRMALTREEASDVAPVFAATVGLAGSYPPALRNRLLPIAAEAMAVGGAPESADALLTSLPDEPLLAMARAIRLEQKGEVASGLAAYDELSAGRDRLTGARAATRATLLRLTSGAISPADAGLALERGYGDWRGDARERDVRLLAAGIQAKAGQWRRAFDTLKETAQLFPADRALVAAKSTALLGDLLQSPTPATIAPLDLVALAGENADIVAKKDTGALALMLADKLTALDLPQRAAPVLEKLAEAAPAGATRAALGARLAAMRLSEEDVAGAAAALATTDAPDLPPPLQVERAYLDARTHAKGHDVPGALAILSRLEAPAADEVRATLLGESGDWHGAALALETAAGRSIPADGPLAPDQQDLLLRLASAFSRAGDDAALHTLGAKQAARMSGPRSGMFRLLTAPPVVGVGDLRRNAGDIALARALPSSLNAIGVR